MVVDSERRAPAPAGAGDMAQYLREMGLELALLSGAEGFSEAALYFLRAAGALERRQTRPPVVNAALDKAT